MNTKFLIFFFSLSLSINAQLKKTALFIGNSYTYVNNLPQMIKDLALTKSDTLDFDQIVVGGFTFQNHCNATTWTKIRSKKWDFVIVQGQSQEPSFSPTQVMSQSYPFAKQIMDSVHAANACTDAMFFMTWGRKFGDASNCGSYPPVCTFTGMQARLRESYMLFKDSFATAVAPVGVAWKNCINAYPSIDLYDADQSHPNLWGSYLSACVFYSSIFQKTSLGSSYTASLPTADATAMQTIGSKTVLDSISTWNLNSQKPLADFTYSVTSSLSYQFSNLSKNATNYQWSFGSTQKNPVYTFTTTGTYSIKLKSLNACTSDSLTKSIIVSGIENLQNTNSVNISISQKYLSLTGVLPNQNLSLYVYTLEGKILKVFEHINTDERFDISDLATGIYLANIASKGASKSLKFSIVK